MSATPTVDDMNEAIAMFDGWQLVEREVEMSDFTSQKLMCFEKEGYWRYHYDHKYHSSWDALMPVVEKIESLYEGYAFTVEIKGDWCLITQNTQHWMAFSDTIDMKGINVRKTKKINSVYMAVFQFIQWYNQINKQ